MLHRRESKILRIHMSHDLNRELMLVSQSTAFSCLKLFELVDLCKYCIGAEVQIDLQNLVEMDLRLFLCVQCFATLS